MTRFRGRSIRSPSPHRRLKDGEMGMRSRMEAIISSMVLVHPHEISALIHSASCFFFVIPLPKIHPQLNSPFRFASISRSFFSIILQILSAYFVILPLRDEGAISLGLNNLPGLFVGSLLLTLVAAPLSTLIFSLPNLSKARVRQKTPFPFLCVLFFFLLTFP